jgi:hypothetical protein
MIDIEAVMADFAVRQAERQMQAAEEISSSSRHSSALVEAGIARVEIRFDGCGDSGAVEECACSMQPARSCPDVTLGRRSRQR